MTIGIGGWGPRRKPMALVREILRSPLKDLTVVAYGGADVGMLCAAGKVRKLVFAFVSLDFIPLEPYFRQARQTGALEVMEIDEGMLMLGLKAAAMRVPFIPTRIGLGTDVLRHNPDIKVVDSPYDGKDWVAMPALPLDVALLHVDRADARGVCQITGRTSTWTTCSPAPRTADLCVAATNWSTMQLFRQAATRRATCSGSARTTTGVVHLPGGAHPSSCAPLYGFDASPLQGIRGQRQGRGRLGSSTLSAMSIAGEAGTWSVSAVSTPSRKLPLPGL